VKVAGYTAKKRCSRGTRRSTVSGDCERIETLVKKVAKKAIGEIAVLKKADAAVASASVDRLAAARAAAALKRQKKSAAKTARMKGKIDAAVGPERPKQLGKHVAKEMLRPGS
jgi:ribosomal protein L12E/L44/L45/RPP1/RPP2